MKKLFLSILLPLAFSAGVSAQTHFETPEKAVQGFRAALAQKGDGAVLKLFGPEGGKLLDPTPDGRKETSRLLQLLFKERWMLAKLEGDDRKLLRLGDEGWPFPVTLAKNDQGWYFDAAAGVEEILNRRIGRNELLNIETLGQIKQAEDIFRAKTGHYTSQAGSTPGKHDGLYWTVTGNEKHSPLEDTLKDSAKYAKGRVKGSPWFGYRYHFLKSQGAAAPGGAQNYVINGKQTGGWAVIAYPAAYGKTGVMSFMCGPNGRIYERDLGADTVTAAKAITVFDPDSTWNKVDPEFIRR